MNKICSKCKKEKELSSKNFARRKSSKDGFDSQCKECKKQSDAVRYQKNREKFLESKKDYYKNNREKIIDRQRKYYRKNREKCAEATKTWAQNNTLQKRIINGRYRCGGNGQLTASEWKTCKKYFNDSCAYCGISEKEHIELLGERLHQEHIIPIRLGGTYSVDNIVPSCRSCNSKKRNRCFETWYKSSDVYSEYRFNKIMDYLERMSIW